MGAGRQGLPCTPAELALIPGPLPQPMVKPNAAQCWSVAYGLMVLLINRRATAGKGQHRVPGECGDVASSRAGAERAWQPVGSTCEKKIIMLEICITCFTCVCGCVYMYIYICI